MRRPYVPQHVCGECYRVRVGRGCRPCALRVVGETLAVPALMAGVLLALMAL